MKHMFGVPALAVLALFAAHPAIAQSPPTHAAAPAHQLLNSERIAARFGSYGIEVLENGARVRVSNLYSTEHGIRTCRTFAVVLYPEHIPSELAAEHAEILRGGSIGAVFAAHGFTVRKTHLEFGETAATKRLAELMHVAVGTTLALHAYVLDVVKDGATFEYAALVEIHHPNYLRRADLRSIYGAANAHGREALLEDLLATAADKARR